MKTICTCLVWLSLGGLAWGQPLRLHPRNPHVFLYQGRPTVIVGSGEHYGAVANPDFDYRKYLRTLGRERLNTTRLFTGPHKEQEGSFGIERNTLAPRGDRYLSVWARSGEPGYVGGGNKFDLSRWDEAYFARLKDFMREAERQGVIVEVCLFSSFYGPMWPLSPLHPANNVNRTPDLPYKKVQTLEGGAYWAVQEAYVRKVVRELNPFDNLYYEVQNEPWADNGVRAGVWNEYIEADMLKDAGQLWRTILEPANEAALAWQKKVAAVIRDEETKLPKTHLISQNYGNFRLSLADVDPNINILNFHYAHPEAVTLNRHWARPVGFNETGFAGREDGAYRRQAWRFMMSGGALFNHLDYSFTVGREDGADTGNKAPGGGSPALRRQLSFLKDFLHGLDLLNLRPESGSFVEARGAFTWAMSNGRDEWAIYCEGHQPFSLRLRLPPGLYVCEWADVRTGEVTKKEKLSGKANPVEVSSGGNFAEAVLKVSKIRSGRPAAHGVRAP